MPTEPDERSYSVNDPVPHINPSQVRPEAALWQTEDFQQLRAVVEAGKLDEVG